MPVRGKRRATLEMERRVCRRLPRTYKTSPRRALNLKAPAGARDDVAAGAFSLGEVMIRPMER
jgi:hypothetical protein